MSREIDTRVVEMQFNNSQFESNAKTTLGTLDRLKNALDFSKKSSEVTNSIGNIQRSVDKVDFSPFATAIDSVQNRFSTLGIVGATVINNLTNTVVEKAKNILTAIPRQISEGGLSRALNIEQAKFMLKGLDVEWNKISDDINYGVQDTAYGLDAAAKAASQLVASGVKFGETYGETGNSPMAKALRGISGVAAMTNSSYEEISSIFTTVAGQGKLMTMQLRQMEARGLNVAAQMGKVLGKTEEQVRDMVTKGEVDFKMFSEAMDTAFGEQATKANETYTGSLSNVKAALNRIGAEFKTSRIDNLRRIFVASIPVLKKFKTDIAKITSFVNTLSTMLTTRLVKSIGKIDLAPAIEKINTAIGDINIGGNLKFESVFSLLTKVNEAGKLTTETLKETEAMGIKIVSSLAKNLGKNEKEVRKMIKKGEIGLSDYSFALLDVLSKNNKVFKSIGRIRQTLEEFVSRAFKPFTLGIKSAYWLLSDFFSYSLKGFAKGFDYTPLEFLREILGRLESVIVVVSNSLNDLLMYLGETATIDKLSVFFEGLGVVLRNIYDIVGGLFQRLVIGFRAIFGISDKATGFTKIIDFLFSALEKIGTYLISLDGFGEKINGIIDKIFNTLKSSLSSSDSLLSKVIGAIKSIISWLWKLKDGVQNVSGPIEYIKNLLESLKPVANKIISAFDGVWTSIKEGFAGAFGDIGNTFKSGGPASWYFGLLNFFTVISALLSSGILKNFTKNFTEFFDTLLKGKHVLGRFEGTLSTIRQPFINLKYVLIGYQKELEATALMKIAKAIALLTVSLLMLSTIDPNEMQRAVTGLTAVMTALLGSLALITKMDISKISLMSIGSIGQATTGMIKIAAAVLIMAIAVKSLSGLDEKALGRGLGAMSAILGIFAVFFKVLDTKVIGTTAPRIVEIAGSLVTFAIALDLLVVPVKAFGGMDINTLAKGLGTIAAMFIIFAGFFKLLNSKTIGTTAPRIVEIAGSLVTFAIALNLLVIPIKVLGAMDPASLGRGIGTVSLMLIELVAAIGVLSGIGASGKKLAATAASLILLSVALGNLAIVIKMLGSMNIPTLVIGIVALAGVMAVLVGAAVVAQTALTGLLALSGVLLAFGVAAAGVGAGLFLISAGLSALVGIGLGGISMLVTSIGMLLTLIPVFFEQLGLGLVTFLGVLTASGDAIINFVAVMITSLAKGINQALPELGKLLSNLLDFIFKCINEYYPKIKIIILTLLDMLLDIGYDFIPKLNTFLIDTLSNILDTINSAIPILVDKGAEIVINFINSVANTLSTRGEQVWEAIYNLLMSILDFLGLKVRDFVKIAGDWITGIRNGIHDKINEVIQAMADIVTSIGNWFSQKWSDFKSWGANIVRGLISGLESVPIIGTIISLGKKIKNAFTGEMEIHSPSKVFYRYGVYLTAGLIKGLKESGTKLKKFVKGWISILDLDSLGIGLSIMKFDSTTTKAIKKQVDVIIKSALEHAKFGQTVINKYLIKYNDFLNKQTINQNKNTKAYKNAVTLVKNLSENLYKNSDAYKESVKNVRLYTKAISKEQTTLTKNNNKIKALEKERTKASKKRKKEIDNEIKSLKKSNKDIYNNVKDLNKALKGELKTISEGPKNAYKEFRVSLRETIKGSSDILKAEVSEYVNLFERFEEAEEISVNDLLSNMQSQIAGISKWRSDLDVLASKGIGNGLLAKLESLGPDGAKYVQAFTRMTEAELKKANRMFEAEAEINSQSLIDNMKKQLAAVETWSTNIDTIARKGIHFDILKQLEEAGPDNAEYVQALADMTESQIAEINSLYSKSKKLPSNVANNILSALSLSLGKTETGKLAESTKTVGSAIEEVLTYSFEDAASEVSTEAEASGYTIGNSISVGIKSSEQSIKDASKLVGESAVKEFKTYFSTDNGSSIAVQITNGLVSGLGSGELSVAEAARALAVQAYNAMKEELDIHSPSRRMEELGRFSDLGLAKGLIKYTSFVTKSAELVGNDTYNALKDTLNLVTESIMDEVNQPVIRPVLDLSDVNSKAGRINDLFESGKIVANVDSIDQNQNGRSIQFVQNNYSPKALPRIEIYRQTRNLISTVKGASKV